MKKWLTYIVVIIIIIVAVKGGMKLVEAKKQQEASKPVAVTYDMRVKTITTNKEKNSLTLPYIALTKSNDDVKISSRISARINYIVKTGKIVKKGDIIVKIDQSDIKAKIDSTNSQIKSKKLALQNLENTHKRTLKLLEVRGASQEQSDKELTNIEAIKAGIETLNHTKNSLINTLSYANIKAPVSGVVTRLANIGDIAMMGKPLITISAKSNSYLLVRLPNDIKANAIIFNNKRFALNPLNTSFNGLLEYVANIDESLTSNQTVSVDVVIFDDDGYKLPHDAILNRDGKSFVLTLVDNHAVSKEVKIISNGEQGVIVDNITKDDKIIVAKQDILLKLLSGIKIREVE